MVFWLHWFTHTCPAVQLSQHYLLKRLYFLHCIFLSPLLNISCVFSSAQLLSHVWLFATPWTAARQASLSITNSWSLLKRMSTESAMPSNHLTLCLPFLLHLQSFPASRSFQTNQFFASGGQRTGVSASASVFPMNIQEWFPLRWTGRISLQSKEFSRVFSNTQFESINFKKDLLSTALPIRTRPSFPPGQSLRIRKLP